MQLSVDFQGIVPPARVVCGLSGGADSVALTHLAKQLGYTVYAVHLNHCLRGEESERDEAFVRAFCEQWQIPLTVKRVEIATVAKQQSMGLEECGRQQRYELFEQVADCLQQDGQSVSILTAHTLSDQVETVLMRLVRGSGLHGMCGIPSKRGRILRPLLGCSRAEIEAYCAEEGLNYVTDSSNAEVQYTRNRLRQDVLPILTDLNPSLLHRVEESVQIWQEEDALLEQWTQEQYPQVTCAEGLLQQPFAKQPLALQRRLLVQFCKQEQVQVNTALIQRVLTLLTQKNGREEAGQGKFFQLSRGILSVKLTEEWQVQLPQSVPESAKLLPKEGVLVSKTGRNFKIKSFATTSSQSFHKICKKSFDIWLDCGKIVGSISYRTRQPKDCIKLAPNRPTKSVKKWFCDLQVPLAQRNLCLVLVDELGVVAVEGLGVAVRVCCDEQTTEVCQLELQE